MRTRRHKPSAREGIVIPDDAFATLFGFSSLNFDGYLWKDGNDVWVPVITSKHPGHGNLSQLFRSIVSHGYKVLVPTPFGRMQSILKHLEFKKEVRPWVSSPHPMEEKSFNVKEWIWERHKMGVMLKGTSDGKNQVEVWIKKT